MTARVVIAAYILVIGMVSAAWFRSPLYNWDLLAYMGVVLSWETHDVNVIHTHVYDAARARLPPARFGDLTTQAADPADRPYRADVYANPRHFAEQLPFYQVRPAYVGAIYTLHRSGVDLVRSAVTISVLAYAGIALLVFAWLAHHLPVVYAALVALLLSLSAPMLDVARSVVPDGLSALMLLAGMFLLLEQRRARLAVWILLASVFVRSDNVILVVMLYALLAWEPPVDLSRPRIALFGLAAMASYFAITAVAGTYGWASLFQHTFHALLVDPADHTVSVSASAYLKTLLSGLRSFVVGSSATVFLLFGVMAWFVPARSQRAQFADRLLLVLTANATVRFTLFPVIWDRFFVAHYLAVAVILIVKAAAFARSTVADVARA